LVKELPLVFNSGARPQTDFRSQHHGIEGLVKDNPEPTVELNVEDAQERGIESGDLVEVRTPRGKVPFRARVTNDIMKGAVECTFGGGTPVGPKSWQKWNVNELTDINNYDVISGFPVYKALLCDVVKMGQRAAETHTVANKQEAVCDFNITMPLIRKSKPEKRIYLDNNATTQVADEVWQAMIPYLKMDYGNPSSIYNMGREAREAMEKARHQVAKLINAQPRRIIFTGGGSEADNLALKGVAFAQRDSGNHIITTRIEHPAILSTCDFLERLGYRITYLEVDKDGWLAPEKLQKAITDDTILVSIMMANNEVGTIMPIEELCNVAHERGILFHTDAVQAIGKIKVDVQKLDIDRAGTENVPAIVGMGKAAQLAAQAPLASQKIERLRDKLDEEIKKLMPDAKLNGHRENRLPNTLNLTLPGLRGESIVLAMDQHSISLSSGSACKSGSPEPTHVLLAMGRTEEEAHCSVRFSLSHYTTEEDITDTVSALVQVLEEKSIVRLMPCK